jgi:3,4-dihydroxy 2-butanone 4-phosphate synthase/GTP cyclohydrolase II
VEKLGARPLLTAYGEFMAHAWRDKPSQGLHLALVRGAWDPSEVVPVRVHEPLSVLDALELNRSMHTWNLDDSLKHIAGVGRGVAVLLNCGESAEQLLAQFEGTAARRRRRPSAAAWTCAPTAWARRSCANAACSA